MAPSTRERLIDTALELFFRNGFNAVGLDRVIAEVGVTKTTFYNHFESKDDLVVAAIEKRDVIEKEFWERTIERYGGEDPRTQLLAIFDGLESWFNDEEFRGCIFLNTAAEFPSPHDPAHKAAAKRTMAMQTRVCDLADEIGFLEPSRFAEQLTILIEGAAVLRYVCGNRDAAEAARSTALALFEHSMKEAELARVAVAAQQAATPVDDTDEKAGRVAKGSMKGSKEADASLSDEAQKNADKQAGDADKFDDAAEPVRRKARKVTRPD